EGGATGAGLVVGSDVAADTTDVVCVPLAHDLTLAVLPVGRAVPPSDIERRVLYRRGVALFDAYDAVVVDAGARMEMIAGALANAGLLLVVATPDRVALAASFAVLKVAATRAPALATAVLVNRADEHTGLAAYRAVRGGAEAAAPTGARRAARAGSARHAGPGNSAPASHLKERTHMANEATKLWEACRAGDADARERLVADNLALVHHVARKIQRTVGDA